jgi:hypothetical protein
MSWAILTALAIRTAKRRPVMVFIKRIAAATAVLLLTSAFSRSASARMGQVAPRAAMPCVEWIPHLTMPDRPPWKEHWPTQVLGSPNCDEVKRGVLGTAASCFCIDQAGIDARTGCCAGHRGVCGCQNQAVMCCDGTASPTCSCHQ